jgi:hypothetical protein
MALELVNPGKEGAVHMRVRMRSYAHMLAPARASRDCSTVLFVGGARGAIRWVDGEDVWNGWIVSAWQVYMST